MVVPVVICIEMVPSRKFAMVILKSLVSISIPRDVLKPRVKQYRY